MAGGVMAIILAAGSSRRMGERNKLLEEFRGRPLLTHVLENAIASECIATCLVTGHDFERVQRLADGLKVEMVHNGDFEEGMGSSLRCGIKHTSEQKCEGALILLADMPEIDAVAINKLLEEFVHNPDAAVISTSHGKPRNPVLWPARYFKTLMQIEGDKGARDLIKNDAVDKIFVELGAKADFDLDTPEAFQNS